MKIKNVSSAKIISIGSVALLPDKSMNITKAQLETPAVKAFIAKGWLVVDNSDEVAKAKVEKDADDAAKKAEKERAEADAAKAEADAANKKAEKEEAEAKKAEADAKKAEAKKAEVKKA